MLQRLSGVKMPRLSVIIPHRGDASALAVGLTALTMQSLPPDEIIVVGNNDIDDSPGIRAVVEAICGSATVIHQPQIGAGLARNAGVAASGGEWLAFVDSDCRPAPDWIASGRQALETLSLFGGAIDVVAPPGTRPTPVEAFDIAFGFDAERFLRRSGHLLTTNLFCTRAVFDLVGPFRSGVPEDKEWSWRARAAGLDLAVRPEVVVEHPALATWPELAYRWRRMTVEEYALSRERRFGQLRFWLRSWLVLASIVPHSLRSMRVAEIVPARRVIAVLMRIRSYRFIVAHELIVSAVSGRVGKLRPNFGGHPGRDQ